MCVGSCKGTWAGIPRIFSFVRVPHCAKKLGRTVHEKAKMSNFRRVGTGVGVYRRFSPCSGAHWVLTCLTGSPAGATVTAEGGVRCRRQKQ